MKWESHIYEPNVFEIRVSWFSPMSTDFYSWLNRHLIKVDLSVRVRPHLWSRVDQPDQDDADNIRG